MYVGFYELLLTSNKWVCARACIWVFIYMKKLFLSYKWACAVSPECVTVCARAHVCGCSLCVRVHVL